MCSSATGLSQDESPGTVKIPWDFVVDSEKFDSAIAAKNLKVPSLHLLGLTDTVAPPDSIRMVYKNCDTKIARLVELPNTPHDFKNYPEELEKVSLVLIGFLEEHLSVA